MSASLSFTQNTLLEGRVKFLQPQRGYRAAIDPVFLAAAVCAEPDQHILDVGLGAGAASLCLAFRMPEVRITGLEIQEDMAHLARENAKQNGWEDRFQVICGDIANPPGVLRTAVFDHVMTNPPYLEKGKGTSSPLPKKEKANELQDMNLKKWLAFCGKRLKPKGTLTLIHRADHIDVILAAMDGNFGSVVVFPLWPKAGMAAKRVLVQARKNGKSPAVFAPGLVLHEQDGRYTLAAERVLREAAPLFLTE